MTAARHGGARPALGRPPGSDPHSRTVSISLSQSSDALLDALQARLSADDRCAVTASEVVRRALVELALVELARMVDGERG